jgi:hypothetical protein
MRLIEGYFRHSRRVRIPCRSRIVELYISDVAAPNNPDEFLVTSEEGALPIFDCARREATGEEKRFKGYVKYRVGEEDREFRLVKGQGSPTMFVEDEPYFIETRPAEEPTFHLVLRGSRLVRREIELSDEEEELVGEEPILPFLKLIKPTYHSRFHYFSMSHVGTLYGQVLCVYLGGRVTYHTILSKKFFNFNQVFSNLSIVDEMMEIPYYPHTQFMVSRDWEIVYESLEYEYEYRYPPGFILHLLSSILMEERIIFCSRSEAFVSVMAILDLIRPFAWQHILFLPLPEEMDEVLESPMPFIVCVGERPEGASATVVDLDRLEIHNYRRAGLLLEREVEEQMAVDVKSAMRKYFSFIAETILRARAEAIRTMSAEDLREIVVDPGKFMRMPQDFYQNFFKTRMFLVFVNEGPLHPSRYLVDTREKTSVFLPYVLIGGEWEVGAYKLWIGLYRGDLGRVLGFLREKGILNAVMDAVFMKLSCRGEYEQIKRLISSGVPLEAFRAINVVPQMPLIDFGDLSGYAVYLLEACDCRALHANEQGRGEHWRAKKGLAAEIKGKLRSIEQSIFDLEREECHCPNHRSVVFVDGMGHLCYLLTPENVSLVLSNDHAPQGDRLQAFWSAVSYFLYFDLPITHECMDVEVDFVIDEVPQVFGSVSLRPSFFYAG